MVSSYSVLSAHLLIVQIIHILFRISYSSLTPEPDLFFGVAPNIPVSPSQNAKDFETLKSLVAEKSPSIIAGPDVASAYADYFGE